MSAEIKQIEKRCVAMWQENIRLEYKGKCAYHINPADCFGGLHGHHIIRRGVKSVKFNRLTGILVCDKAHDWIGQNKNDFLYWLYCKDVTRRVFYNQYYNDQPTGTIPLSWYEEQLTSLIKWRNELEK